MSRWIDADELGASVIKNTVFDKGDVIKLIEDAPSIDIVRCQDCKHWVYNFNGCSRNPCTEPWYADDFCSYGERDSEKPNKSERSSE